MPLVADAPALIRSNLEDIQNGKRARLVVIGTLSDIQLSGINQHRRDSIRPPVLAEVVFFGSHIYRSRVWNDGYTIDDVIDQILSGMDAASLVRVTKHMTSMENPNPRPDRYGNFVRDRVVFECSARYPRPELFSVIPKGDRMKPKGPFESNGPFRS